MSSEIRDHIADEIWHTLERGAYASCLELVRRKRCSNPSDLFYQFLEAELFRRLGRISEADRIFRDLHPQEYKARDEIEVHLGQICETRGQFTEAESWFRKALASKPEDFGVFIYYAGFLMHRERFDEAIQILNSGISTCTRGNKDEAYFNLARCQRAQDDYAGAKASYETALSISSDYALAQADLKDLADALEIRENTPSNGQPKA